MTSVFVDTNVLLYSEDVSNPAKQARAIDWLRALWLRRLGRLNTQMLDEIYSNATRKLKPPMPPMPPMPQGDARAEVRRYQRWQPWLLDHATVETAWSVQSRFSLIYRDALIVAAAQAQDCRYLLSEGVQHQQVMDQMQTINPFLVGPEMLDATG